MATEKVFEVLAKSNEPLKTVQIVEQSGLTKAEVDKAIKALKADGRINSPKRCFYAAVAAIETEEPVVEKCKIKGLAHIGIFAKDIDKSIDFYERLGFTLDKEENMGIRLVFLSAGSCFIELIEQKETESRPAGVVDHIAVEVDDIEEAVKCAKANKIDVDASKIESVNILGGIKNVFFCGPDGERLEFFEYIK